MSFNKIIDEIEWIKSRAAFERLVGFDQWVILNDIEFMLNEFKKERKLKEVKHMYRSIYNLVIDIGKGGPGRYLWEYSTYLIMKKIYLSTKGVYERRP